MTTFKHLALFAMLVTSTSILAEPIDESREMAADGRVTIEIMSGNISIASWDRNEFMITGDSSDSAEGYEIGAGGRNISFKEEYTNDRTFFSCLFSGNCLPRSDTQSDYEILIPVGASLNVNGVNVDVILADLGNSVHVETVNGDIDIENSSGEIRLNTVNGDISSFGLTGRIHHETVNGRIDINDSRGERATLGTVNGRIDAELDSPRIDIETVNGKIELKTAEIYDLKVESVNGDIELTLLLQEDADIEVSSFNGDIEIEFTEIPSAEFQLETRGDIDNRISDDRPYSTSRYESEEELEFTLGTGSSSVEVESFGGDITLRH